MLKKTINISNECENELSTIQRLNYELVTRERILGLLFTLNDLPFDKSKYDVLYNEYLERFIECDKLKNKIYSEYISQHVDNPDISSWELDYDSGEVKIYEN